MATLVNLSPAPRLQFIGANGVPLVGAQLFTYAAGTMTKQTSYVDSGGVTPNTNPIILDSLGTCSLWLDETQVYKLILAPATDTDPPTNPYWTQDNINPGVGNGSVSSVGISSTDLKVTGSPITNSGTIGLALNTTGVTAGTYGDSSHAVQVTVGADGRITGIQNVTLSAGGGMANPMTTAGDIIVGGVAGAPTRLPIGANGTILGVVAGALAYITGGGGGTVIFPLFNVRSATYGAKGDGTTDDTAAIQACDTAARAAGGSVWFPGGTYMASQLIMATDSIWYGEGIDSTVLTQIIGSNKSFITLNGVVAQRVQLRDLSINGNYNMGAGNTSGDGVDWSAGVAAPIMVNVYLGNIAGNALHTYWSDSQIPGGNQGYPQFRWSMEGYFANVKVFQCGQHGWLNYGPHDSTVIGFLVCNSGQAANNTYDAFHFSYVSGYGAGANGNFFYLHGYQLSNSTNRNRSALYIEQNVSGCRFIGCQFEGAYTPVTLLGNNNNFDSTCSYYASYNGVTMYLGGPSCNGNSIRGHFDGPVSGRPAAVGILVGSLTSDAISLNDIDVMMANQEAGNIQFTSAPRTNNVWRINAFYNATSATFIGLPDPTDDFQIRGVNSGGAWHKNNREQRTGEISISAGAAYTWTFPFAFAAPPWFNFAVAPAGGLSITINSLTATAVTVTNNSSYAIAGFMEAKALT